MRKTFVTMAAIGVLSAFALGGIATQASSQSSTTDTTSTWGCTSSALRATLFTQAPIEPLVANKNRKVCQNDTVGVDDTGPSTFQIAGVDGARAITKVDEGLAPAGQQPEANATVANARITAQQVPFIELPGTVASSVKASCVNKVPTYTASHTTAPLKIGGTEIPTNEIVERVIEGVDAVTGPLLLRLVPGEEVRTATSFTKRGLHITLHLGDNNVLDLVLAESTVSLNGTPCANTTGGGGGTNNGGGGGGVNTGGGGGPNGPGLSGTPVVGGTFGGARVLPLTDQLLQPRNSPCITGPYGSRLALVGTVRNDRMVGSRQSDRIFMRPGNDIGYAGYGNDCVEGTSGNDIVYASRGQDLLLGRTGNDRLYGLVGNDRLIGHIGNDYLHGGLGNDRLYGQIGNDILTGSYGNDVMYGGVGNETIVPGQGVDRIYAGPGNDLVDARRTGRDTIYCGRGRDRVRAKVGDFVAADCENVVRTSRPQT